MYFNHSMSESAWRTTEQCAADLGVKPRTVYGLANRGELVGYRIGRVYRWRVTDIAEFLDRQRLKPGSLGHLVGDGDA